MKNDTKIKIAQTLIVIGAVTLVGISTSNLIGHSKTYKARAAALKAAITADKSAGSVFNETSTFILGEEVGLVSTLGILSGVIVIGDTTAEMLTGGDIIG